jgi:predicted DNA-binding WGR domain protein
MNDAQLEIFPDSIRIERREPEHNRHRFYRMYVQPDLFGSCTLFREWGRIGTAGRQVRDLFADEGQAVDALMVMFKKKQRRGYH